MSTTTTAGTSADASSSSAAGAAGASASAAGPSNKDKEVAIKQEREAVLPENSVKRIMKLNKGVTQINSEGLAAMRKSTELFLEFLALEAFKALQKSKRKTINMEDIAEVLKVNGNCEFLNDAFGPTLSEQEQDNED